MIVGHSTVVNVILALTLVGCAAQPASVGSTPIPATEMATAVASVAPTDLISPTGTAMQRTAAATPNATGTNGCEPLQERPIEDLVVDGALVVNDSEKGLVVADAQLARVRTVQSELEIDTTFDGVVSPDRRSVAFWGGNITPGSRTTDAQLFVVNGLGDVAYHTPWKGGWGTPVAWVGSRIAVSGMTTEQGGSMYYISPDSDNEAQEDYAFSGIFPLLDPGTWHFQLTTAPKYVFYHSAKSEYVLWNVDQQQAQQIIPDANPGYTPPVMAPDEMHFALELHTQFGTPSVSVWSAEKGKVWQQKKWSYTEWLSWSPDSSKVAYLSSMSPTGKDFALAITDLTSGSSRYYCVMTEEAILLERMVWSPNGEYLAYASRYTNGQISYDYPVRILDPKSATRFTVELKGSLVGWLAP